MSDGLATCPECTEPLFADQEWELIDKSKIGEPVGESIQGDYKHRECPNSEESDHE